MIYDSRMKISPSFIPELDPGFVPAVLWNREFRRMAKAAGGRSFKLALTRSDGFVAVHEDMLLPAGAAENLFFVERLLKFLLWQKGGNRILIEGPPEIAEALAAIYAENGARAFDQGYFGERTYDAPFSIEAVDKVPTANEDAVALGRHLDGCRIGFDLGGSDRKAAAMIDGEVVFSEEIKWDPYFQSDPEYHLAGIRETLSRAAAHLPRVDAIGGSAAGVYVNNEVKVASLFRGISAEDFENKVRHMFKRLRAEWDGIPFDVVNDGEVTALAGSMSMNANHVLGISMGTSEAAGYVDGEGRIKPWLNELAFVPVDYRKDGPVDEWSGDEGCGVQYFTQQGVARLAPAAGFEFGEMPFAEQLEKIQQAMAAGDERAAAIYRTLGTCFGYAIAHYADFYEIENLLILGRVTSGRGGEIILEKAREVLAGEFPELSAKISMTTPDEKMKRHGQAVAAASLAALA